MTKRVILPRTTIGDGLASLQKYYKEIARQRGWDNETPRDTLLLLTEELGELARAVRKAHGLKRDAGYADVSVGEELADIQLYLVHLANSLDIDLAKTVLDKETKNTKRFENLK